MGKDLKTDKVRADFAVVTKGGEVAQIGRSSILVPKTNFNGKGVNWFDDAQLLRKQPKESSSKDDKE